MNAETILKKYEELKSGDKAVLNVLAITCDHTEKTRLAGLMRKFGRTDSEKELGTVSRLAAVIDRLIKSGLVDKYFSIDTETADIIYKLLVNDDDAIPIAEETLGSSSLVRYEYYNRSYIDRHEIKNILRHFRLSIIASSEHEYFRIKKLMDATGMFSGSVESLCMNPVRYEWLKKKPPAMLADILDGMMGNIFINEKPVPEETENLFISINLKDPTDSMLLSRRLYLMAMAQLLSRGSIDIKKLETYGLETETDFYGLYGLDMLISGKKSEAAQYWKNSIAAAKKTTRKKNWIVPGYCGVMYIYLVMAGLAEESDQTIKTFFSFIAKNLTLAPEIESSAAFLNRAWLFRNLEITKDEFISITSSYIANNINFSGITFLFMMLSLCLVENEPPEYMDHQCVVAYGKMKKNKSLWLMSETGFFLEHYGKISGNTEKVRPFLADSFRPGNQWESTLESLKKIFAASEIRPDSSNKRIAWIVNFREKSVFPVEQRLGAKGEWSTGKNKSVKKLKSEKPDFLTEQDERILGSMEMEYDYYKGYDMKLTIERAVPLMVGHPSVYEKNEDGTLAHIDLISGKPELSIKKDSDGITVQIHPFPDNTKIWFIKEPQGKIKLVQFSDELVKVARIIGEKGISVPYEAEEKITGILGSASLFLDIQSDLAATSWDIETVESDPMPRVLLYPAGGAIRADIAILPLGENGPSFKPGQGGEIIMTELDGKRLQAIRNLPDEKKGAKTLVEKCPSLEQSAKSFHWYSEDLEDIIELVTELKEAAEQGITAVSWPEGKKFGIRASLDTDRINLKISSGIDWFDIEGTATVDDGEQIGLKTILKGLSRDSRFIRIGENEFLALSRSLHKKLLSIESASQTVKTGARIGKGSAIMLREVLSGINGTKTDRAWKDFQKRIEEAINLDPEIPSTLQAELRPYQAEGFTWLCRLGALGTGACLADDMGLGKTVQTLAFLLSVASKGPSLVVAPTSVCGNWVAETVKFAPTLNPVIFGGNEREQMLGNLAPMDLLIVSYGLMQQEEKLFGNINWNVAVLDEAQAIKNETSKRTQTALKLKADFRLITTGTPVENSLDELYTLFSFINPGLLGSKTSFNEKFAFPIEREKNRAAQNSLRQLIKPFILRRLRTDVLDDLPEKTEIVINVESHTDQKALYETLRKNIVEDLENAENQPAGQKYLKILAGITKLRLACCHPELAVPGCGTCGAKTDVFMELVEELIENRHKALVFSQFTSFLSIAGKLLDEKGIKYLYLDGSTPAKERNENVAMFQEGRADLFLISLKAGGTGLNLTAANYVIHLDPWWNPAVEDQASARAHRMGQKQPVTIYRLVMKESIEEKIMALHKYKKNLADSILEGTDSAGKMSAEELMNLIKNG